MTVIPSSPLENCVLLPVVQIAVATILTPSFTNKELGTVIGPFDRKSVVRTSLITFVQRHVVYAIHEKCGRE
jgi:hypothetical protein